MAAALGSLVCRSAGCEAAVIADARDFFAAAVARHAEAFADVMTNAEPKTPALVEATEIPLEIAARARALQDDLDSLRSRTPPAMMSDLVTAVELARAALAGAVATAQANLLRIADDSTRAELEARLAKLQ
jgi:formiminotetrahydrofolate cyclodeaminase